MQPQETPGTQAFSLALLSPESNVLPHGPRWLPALCSHIHIPASRRKQWGGVSKDILMARLSPLPEHLPPQGFPCCFQSLWSHLGAHVNTTPYSWNSPAVCNNSAHWVSRGGPPHFAGGRWGREQSCETSWAPACSRPHASKCAGEGRRGSHAQVALAHHLPPRPSS